VEGATSVLKPDHGGADCIDRGISSEDALPLMSTSFESPLPSDIRLLLRADAEQCWLHREVIPVLRQVEDPQQLHEEEVGAALAYLEAMWSEATLRARETDAAHSQLCSRGEESEALEGPAGRYHAAVRVLREIVSDRITPFVEPTLELEGCRSEAGQGDVRIADKRRDGCPRAA
jgi:hypothetical protein